MNSTLLFAENAAKVMAFLIMALIFVKSIRSELE